jgi:hypothetical protein
MAERLGRLYADAPDSARADGAEWYATARLTCHALAADGHYTPAQVAGIVAALSPRVSWEQNVAAAYRIIEAGRRAWPQPMVAGTGSNRRKAWSIACGGDPAEILGGPKVRAFFANLTGDDHAVTVDVWAALAALGRPVATIRGAQYLEIADAYRMAARDAEITPRELQATVWCAIRGRSSLDAFTYVQPSLWALA